MSLTARDILLTGTSSLGVSLGSLFTPSSQALGRWTTRAEPVGGDLGATLPEPEEEGARGALCLLRSEARGGNSS